MSEIKNYGRVKINVVPPDIFDSRKQRAIIDRAFIERWQTIFETRDLHTEIQHAKPEGARICYLGRALFHAYHAEIDEYVRGRDEPKGGFPTDHGGVSVQYGGALMDEQEMRFE